LLGQGGCNVRPPGVVSADDYRFPAYFWPQLALAGDFAFALLARVALLYPSATTTLASDDAILERLLALNLQRAAAQGVAPTARDEQAQGEAE